MSAVGRGEKRRRVDVCLAQATVDRDLQRLEDTHKLEYACREVESEFPLAGDGNMRDDLRRALEWTAERSSDRIVPEREAVMQRIRSVAARVRRSGKADKWLSGVDCVIKCIASEVNGPLLQQLLHECGHADVECA